MNHSQPTLWWNIRHWWYNHISGPLFGPYLTWRTQTPEYRALMTDIGRSFLMREMRLRRIPGVLIMQQRFRSWRPAQSSDRLQQDYLADLITGLDDEIDYL